MSASNTIARRTYTRREKHRIAKDISRLLRGDLFVSYQPGTTNCPGGIEDKGSKGHLWSCAIRFVGEDEIALDSFYMDDRDYDGDPVRAIVEGIREQAALLLRRAKSIEEADLQ